MRIEVTKIKKGKTDKKAQEIDIIHLLAELLEKETEMKEKAGIKVVFSSEEIELGKAIASRLDRIDYFASEFIMPLVTMEFDISNEKRLEYMKRTKDKLLEIIDDMERLLFGAFKLDEVKRNDNED